MKRLVTQRAYLVCMVIMTVFVSFLSGCGGGGGGHWNEPDTTRPTVTSSVPAAATPVLVVLSDTEITATFNKNMDPATITALGAFTLTGPDTTTPVPGAATPVTYDAASKTATFHPAAALTPGTYTATIKGTGTSAVKDTVGNTLAGNSALPLVANDYQWRFTTSVTAPTFRPFVISTVPVTSNPIPVVLTTTPITARFNKDMLAASITSGTFTVTRLDLTPVQGAATPVTYVGGTTRIATFHPAAVLPAGTYIATIKGTGPNAAKDSSGNALAGKSSSPSVANDYVWRFTTSDVVTPPSGSNVLDLMSYGIASAGGITNVGATKINGNVVLDPNKTCNLEPILFEDGPGFGVCGGNPINIPTVNSGDLVITQVYPDTTTADTVIAALNVKWKSLSPASLPGATTLGCGTIGNAGDAGALIGCSGNSTLAPGTYISAAGSTIGIAGDLTLNGSATDEWFFQAPTALSAEVSSRIILTGGAKASNVWWYVGSSATIKTNSTFQGNILASAAISMQEGATSCGRLLSGASGAGAFTFLGNTVSVPGHPNAPAGCK